MNAPSAAPVRKVVAATIAAAVATIVLWALGDVAMLPINEAVSAAIVTLVVAIVGYLVPAAEADLPTYLYEKEPADDGNRGFAEPSGATGTSGEPVRGADGPDPERPLDG